MPLFGEHRMTFKLKPIDPRKHFFFFLIVKSCFIPQCHSILICTQTSVYALWFAINHINRIRRKFVFKEISTQHIQSRVWRSAFKYNCHGPKTIYSEQIRNCWTHISLAIKMWWFTKNLTHAWPFTTYHVCYRVTSLAVLTFFSFFFFFFFLFHCFCVWCEGLSCITIRCCFVLFFFSSLHWL